MEWTDDIDWSALIQSMASKVKFFSIVAQNARVYPLSMRPGGGNENDEFDLNERQFLAARAAADTGCHVLAAFPDAAPKEQKWVREKLICYMAYDEVQRHPRQHGPNRPFFAGVGVFHQLKSLRNAVVFGGSVPPYGGQVVRARCCCLRGCATRR